MMHGTFLLRRGLNFRTVFLGAFVGGNAALPMYLWQHTTSVAIACWIVVGYTVWLWAATAEAVSDYRHQCGELRALPFNGWSMRATRMFGDVGYWWSTLFGCATITGSAWYVGINDPVMLTLIGAGWCLVSTTLNWSLTLLHPTTRCRRCYYQLAAHIESMHGHDQIICPECGAHWTKEQLGIGVNPPPSKQSRRQQTAAARHEHKLDRKRYKANVMAQKQSDDMTLAKSARR